MTETDCFVCQKHRGLVPVPGGAIYEDELTYASHGIIPEGNDDVFLGWVFVEPKRHAPGLADLTDGEASAIGVTTTRISRALLAATGGEHVYAAVLGHQVAHLHIHLIVRYPNTPREYWGLNLVQWPGAPHGRDDEIAEFAEQMRKALR
jgi:histidine triad (HIT) family protein